MTAIYGVFGWPVAHSRSPAMHNAAFAELGLDARYVPFAIPPARLAQAIEAVRALDVAGLNVTLPHKSAVMPLLDAVEPSARAIAAVNTIARDGDRLIGSNTDAEGLARALRSEKVTLVGAQVVIVGAGGAARAALVGLAQAGAARITLAARRVDAASTLIRELAPHVPGCALAACDLGPALESACTGASLFVQATSATLATDPGAAQFAAALPIAALPASAVVTDLVYKPLVTAVLARAQARGLRTVDGLGMLLHQGALAFERWTGRSAPLTAMRRGLGL
jgi:shikimate dehydrogenase